MDTESDPLLNRFHPAVREWFENTFDSVTEPQKMAFPAVDKGENILLFSPTGSGKTLAGFLVSINYLVSLAEKDQLKNSVYVVYVSPLRALSNDVRKNLMVPLEGIKERAPFAHIRALVRTGDTSSYRKSKMLRESPHILITTPETLQIILNAPKFREKLTTVRYVIVDEIHDLCDSKRGVSLSLSLERLHNLAGPFVRIGLSATQAPVEDIAQFLVGTDRPVSVLMAEREKHYDLRIVKPTSLSSLSLEKSVEETYDILKELIDSHKITLVFSNTRSRTERIVYQLKERGLDSVAAHHGSMGTETRHHIEHVLKTGVIKSVITSTSLELGIDIGDVDLVVQLGSPKQTAKLMQRVGRAGHGRDAVSKGILVAQDRDELVELEILKRKALSYRLEPVQIPENCLDVLAQHLIGMSLEQVWDAGEAFKVVRQSYCYRNLPFADFLGVLEYLGGYYADLEDKHIHRKLWFDGAHLGRVRSALYLYFLNCGTIPSEANFLVTLGGIPLGTLSDYFVSHLKKGDIFVLGGRSLQYKRIEGMNVVVSDAFGGTPTVPSWRGQAMSRFYHFAFDLSRFREEIDAAVEGGTYEHLDSDIVSYFSEQKKVTGFIPTANTLFIERYIDGDNQYHLIFHFPFGRRVNETLARGYGQKLDCPDFTVTDNGFMLNASSPLHFKKEILTSDELLTVLKASVWGTELFCQRFRHCAERAFLILKNYKGKSISPRTQYFRARSLLKELPFDFPVVKETFNEVLHSALDYEHAREVLEHIEEGTLSVVVSDYTTIPSPFALSIVLADAQDIITLKDRSEFLQHMQQAVTQQVIEAQPSFDPQIIAQYFADRERSIDQGTPEELVLDMLYTRIYTADALAEELGLSREETESILDTLIENHVVSCGYFTSSQLEYMLVSDRRLLEYGEGIDDTVLRAFLMKKHFDFTAHPRHVLQSYGYLRSKRALYDRTGFFAQELLKVKVAGRLVFILPEDASLFVSAYRTPQEEAEDAQDDASLLQFIQDHPGLTRREIVQQCGSDISHLEDNLYVYRDAQNRFYALDAPMGDARQAQEEIVRRFITSCGPVSLQEILYHTRFDRDVLESILSDPQFVTVNIFSRIVQEMYCTTADRETLTSTEKSGVLRFLHHSDPLFMKIQHESVQKLGESFSPLLYEGEIVGGMYFEVAEDFSVEDLVLLSDSLSLQDIFEEILRVYRFYRWQGAHNLVLNQEKVRKIAESLGYTLSDNTLMDAPLLDQPMEYALITQLTHQCLLTPGPVDEVKRIPFLNRSAFSKRTATSVEKLLDKETLVELPYGEHMVLCSPEEKTLYEENDKKALISRVLDSYGIISPFQVQNLVQAELFEIEDILSTISRRVFFHGEIHYMKGALEQPPEEPSILFLSVNDPYIRIHNETWNIEGTAILVNGTPAGYYTVEDNQADLYLFKEFKDFWGTILVKIPSENISLRTINGRPAKDTRFARAFS
jgi:Lhr-like helicase